MKYIYCQLLSLIKEEYPLEDILWELRPNEEEIKKYLENADFKPDQVFEEKFLKDWFGEEGYFFR